MSEKNGEQDRNQSRQVSRVERDENNLPVDVSSSKIFDKAMANLPDNEMQEIRKEVVREQIKLESTQRNMAIKDLASRQQTQDHLDSWQALNSGSRITDRHRQEDTMETSSGTRRIVSKSGPGCFVATAVYGADSTIVKWLRRYRDEILSRSRVGRQFIRWYYRNGPALADYVSGRIPLVWFSRLGVGVLSLLASIHWALSKILQILYKRLASLM